MTLTEIIDNAINSVSIYRNPNLSEFVEAIQPILTAGHMGNLTNDKIEDICYTPEFLWIKTTYTVRQCEYDNEYRIPLEVINSPNPINAAELWYLTEEYARVDSQLQGAKQRVESLSREYDDIVNKLVVARKKNEVAKYETY